MVIQLAQGVLMGAGGAASTSAPQPSVPTTGAGQ